VPTPAVRYALRRLPSVPGVYRFRDGDGVVLYIGRATSLRSRVASYWSDLSGRAHLTAMVAAIAAVEAVPCVSVHEAAWLERNLLESRLPAWNRSAGGQEVEVFIRLDAAGLSVCHSRQGRCFGPYLGGLRARQAARGLRRILPAGQDGEGSAAALALARGAGVTGHQDRVAAAAAILHGDAGAVRWAQTELERQRERASAVLSFELAARIQAELEALSWIASPQRVTTESGDFEVAGIHNGVMVKFGFQSGKLRVWAQSPRSEPLPPALAPGPALTGLVQHSAELAAALICPVS